MYSTFHLPHVAIVRQLGGCNRAAAVGWEGFPLFFIAKKSGGNQAKRIMKTVKSRQVLNKKR